jgi:hypothetical protein
VAVQWRKTPERGFSRECCLNATLVPARFQLLGLTWWRAKSAVDEGFVQDVGGIKHIAMRDARYCVAAAHVAMQQI